MKILTALAQTVTIPNPLASNSIMDLVDKVATWLLEVGLIISTIIIIWAAIVFMTSGGNTERVTTARKTLWYTIIGIVILLLAKGLTSLVANFLGGNF
ncbi:hypothetical protein KKH14_01090 [Patescibacteria group bacterium]|nr:hypothetical protein [Patescibacteria group bacterium]